MAPPKNPNAAVPFVGPMGYNYPEIYPDGGTVIDAAGMEEGGGTVGPSELEIGDDGLPYELPGYLWNEDNPAADQTMYDPNADTGFGGPGNPIDYTAPWNVGAYPSFPGYDANLFPGGVPQAPPPGMIPPPPNVPVPGTSPSSQDEFDHGNPYDQLEEYLNTPPGVFIPPLPPGPPPPAMAPQPLPPPPLFPPLRPPARNIDIMTQMQPLPNNPVAAAQQFLGTPPGFNAIYDLGPFPIRNIGTSMGYA